MDPIKATREYLQGLTRRVADVYQATVVERLTNNLYVVKRIDSGARRYAKGQLGDWHALESRVECQSASASGNAIGSPDTITSRAPQRGLSETTPSVKTATTGAVPLVFGVDPDPLILNRGGSAKEQLILGRNLTSAGAYVENGVGDPPDVTDDDAPVITATEITRTMRAAIDSPLGFFDLLISGHRLKRALQVLPVKYDIVSTLYYVNDATNFLHAVDPATLAPLHSIAITATTMESIGRIGDLVIIAGANFPDYRIFVFDPVYRTYEAVPAAWPGDEPPDYLTPHDGKLWFRPDGASDIFAASVDASGAIVTHLLDPATPGSALQVVVSGTTMWVGDNAARIFKVNLDDFTSAPVAMTDTQNRYLAVHDGSLYVMAKTTSAVVYRRDLATGAAISNIAIPTPNIPAALVSSGGKLFAVVVNFSNQIKVYELADNLSAATLRATIANTGGVGGVTANADAVFMAGGSSGKVHRMAAADYSVTTVTPGGQPRAVYFFDA